MDSTVQNQNWKKWQKVVFRFFTIFLALLTIVAYNPILQVIDSNFMQQLKFFALLIPFVSWVDDHILHLGYSPEIHMNFFSDNRFGVILLFVISVLTIVGTIIWSILDKKRNNYNRFYFWFSNYLAYYVSIAVMGYALIKVIPVQAPYPAADELLIRWGNLRDWEILFKFLGTSPLYVQFCGWIEVVASIMILFKRLRVLGALLMITALMQIVVLNIFYINGVVLLSAILLLATLFIIARAIPKLYLIFVKHQPVSLEQNSYELTTPWKKYVLIILCFSPVWKIYNTSSLAWKTHTKRMTNQRNQKLYEVSLFKIENDTLAPLTTDTVRWKYVCLLDYGPGNKRMVKFNMQEKVEKYIYTLDTLQKTMTKFNKTDTTLNDIFTFKKLDNGNMELNGKWNRQNIFMRLKNMPIDSMTLIKDKFYFMQEQ